MTALAVAAVAVAAVAVSAVAVAAVAVVVAAAIITSVAFLILHRISVSTLTFCHCFYRFGL